MGRVPFLAAIQQLCGVPRLYFALSYCMPFLLILVGSLALSVFSYSIRVRHRFCLCLVCLFLGSSLTGLVSVFRWVRPPAGLAGLRSQFFHFCTTSLKVKRSERPHATFSLSIFTLQPYACICSTHADSLSQTHTKLLRTVVLEHRYSTECTVSRCVLHVLHCSVLYINTSMCHSCRPTHYP